MKSFFLTFGMMGLLLLLPALAFSQDSEGTRLFQSGQYNKAVKVLRKEIKKDGSNAALWNRLGLSYEKLGQYKNAMKAFKKAIGRDRTNADLHANLAFAYLRMFEYKDALKQANKALTLDRTNENAFIVRSLAEYIHR